MHCGERVVKDRNGDNCNGDNGNKSAAQWLELKYNMHGDARVDQDSYS